MDTTTTMTTSTSDAATGAAIGAFLIGYFVFVIALYFIFGFIMGKVFQKAGKPFWAGFVPVYNGWVLFEVGGKPGWWVLISLIPFVGPFIVLILNIIVSLEIAKRFGRSSAFGIVGLWLFSLIGYAILAFDSSKYQGVATETNITGEVPPAPVSQNPIQADDEQVPPTRLVQ